MKQQLYIKYYRELAGVSKKQLAKEIDVSEATISNYESGRSVASMEKIIKIARALNVTTDQLLGFRMLNTKD